MQLAEVPAGLSIGREMRPILSALSVLTGSMHTICILLFLVVGLQLIVTQTAKDKVVEKQLFS